MQQSAGDPVNTATGAWLEDATDASLPGTAEPFALHRTYDSTNTAAGSFGTGWAFALDEHLTVGSDGDVTITADDGEQVVYTENADGTFSPPPGALSTLAASGSQYVLTTPENDVLAFDSSGRLVSKLNLRGQGLHLSYSDGTISTVTDADGRTATFTYSSGLLDQVALPGGRTVTYTYTSTAAGERLASATDPTGAVTQYGYDSSGRLDSVTDADGHTTTTSYDPDTGRVSSQTDPRGNVTSYYWQPDTGTATVVDAAGNAWFYVYVGNVLIGKGDPLDDWTTYTYDDQLDVTSMTDPDGNVTTYTYDAAGRKLTQTDPLGDVQRWTYDSRGDVLTHTDARGGVTTTTYDSFGEPLTVTDSDGDMTTNTYDAAGRPETVTDPNGHTTTYGYDGSGDLVSTVSPLGEETTATYDASGWMLTKTSPRGNVQGADPGDFTTTYGYDADGRTTSITDPDGDTASYTYDPAGNRTAATDPDGHTTHYDYDADNNQTEVTDPDGHWVKYTYDPLNHQTSSQTEDYPAATTAYDAAGRKATTTTPWGAPTSYTYDPDGNVLSVAAPNPADPTGESSATTTYAYDAGGHRTSATDPLGAKTQTSYDPAGDVLTQTDALGKVTTYTYDNAGRELSSTDPDGHLTGYSYDASGSVLVTTLPDGRTSTNSYDADERLAATVYSDSTPSVSYTYDADGNRATMTDGTGTSTYSYDHEDRVTNVTDGSGATVGYGYDADGLLTGLTYPDGNHVSYSYDDAGNNTGITDGLGGVFTFTYDDEHDLVGQHFPDGQTTTFQLVDGYVFNILRGSDSIYYTRSNAAQLVSEEDGSPSRDLTYGYDEDGRLNEYDIDNPSTQDSLQYDATGNPVEANTNGVVSKQAFDGAHELQSLTIPSDQSAPVAHYSYTPNGQRAQMVEQINPSAPTYTFDYTYNAAGELTNYSEQVQQDEQSDGTGKSAGSTAAFAGPGVASQLVPETEPAEVDHYDGDRLLAAQGSTTYVYATLTSGGLPMVLSQVTPTTTTDLVYRPDGTPVEQLSGSTPNYLYTDANGNVRYVTNSSGTTVGTYTYDMLGNATHTGSVTSLLQFNSQLADGYTNTYYLRARYYDPTTDQFLTVDPDAAATRQPFTYANDDPINGSDPTGLCAWWNLYCEVLQPIGHGVAKVGDWIWHHKVETAAIVLAVVSIAAGVGEFVVPEEAEGLASTLGLISNFSGAAGGALDLPGCISQSGSKQVQACTAATFAIAGALLSTPDALKVFYSADPDKEESMVRALQKMGVGMGSNLGGGSLTIDITQAIADLCDS